METISDRELARVRLRCIDIIKSLFITMPDAERFSRWRGTFAALSREQIATRIDRATRELSEHLGSTSLEAVKDEYYTLFVDPFSADQFNLMASFYLDGRNFGDTLISLRRFLQDAGIGKCGEVSDSEDTLPVMLDVLATLIERETQEDTSRLQKTLVQDYLVPYVAALKAAGEANTAARFYASCLRFCEGYIELEESLLD